VGWPWCPRARTHHLDVSYSEIYSDKSGREGCGFSSSFLPGHIAPCTGTPGLIHEGVELGSCSPRLCAVFDTPDLIAWHCAVLASEPAFGHFLHINKVLNHQATAPFVAC